jgi:hypothetical protein
MDLRGDLSLNQSFLLIEDPNLVIILNDPDVSMPIKNLIVKMSTDKLFVSKLSNPVQKDDFKLEARKTYKSDLKDLLTRFTILIDTLKIRKKETKRFEKYFNYIKKKF